MCVIAVVAECVALGSGRRRLATSGTVAVGSRVVRKSRRVDRAVYVQAGVAAVGPLHTGATDGVVCINLSGFRAIARVSVLGRAAYGS